MSRQLDDISNARDLGLSRDDIALYEAAVGILTSQNQVDLARGAAR